MLVPHSIDSSSSRSCRRTHCGSTCKDIDFSNGVTALNNGPLHLQSHSQFLPGIYDPLYMFVQQGDSSGFDVFISVNGSAVDVDNS